jgi:hypothetical protein
MFDFYPLFDILVKNFSCINTSGVTPSKNGKDFKKVDNTKTSIKNPFK